MSKLSATLSKKVPIPGLEYSSQQFSCGLEIDLTGELTQDSIRQKIHNVYSLLHAAIGDGKQQPPVKYSAKAGPTELRQTAVKMLEAFLAHAAANVDEAIAVEEEFLIQMAPGLPKLKGRIDLIEIRREPSGESRLHLVDFKTAAKRMGPEDVDRGQLDLYAIAMRETGLLEQLRLPLVLRLDVVTKVKSPEVTPIEITPNRYNENRVIAKAHEV